MRVLDDEPNQAPEGGLPNAITVLSSLERDGPDRFGQHIDGTVTIFGGRQIELRLTVVTPMSDAHTDFIVQMIECRAKQRFISDKPSRASDLSAFVAEHYKPKIDGSCIVARSGVKGGNRNFVFIVKDSKVFLFEISNGQAGIVILADDINEDQGRLNTDDGLRGIRLPRLLCKTT